MEPTTKPKGYELPDLREKAVNHKGETQISEKRLFLQLQVYTACADPKPLADAAHDIRVSCYGLDQDDNEFIIGLIGKDLTPLSQCVQEMRKTQQTAKYIKKLGPFFVGKVFWQSPATP